MEPAAGSGGVEAPPCPLTVRRRHQLKTFRTDDDNISHRPLPSRNAVAVLDHLAIQCADVATSAEYHPAYYGAFVRDPDGNNVEAVCHTPE